MRRKNITIYTKLSIIILLLIFFNDVSAKKKKEEVNTICFAANGKWICAPENQQEIARKKAADALKKQKNSETLSSDVVINQISFPKFNSTEVTKTEPLGSLESRYINKQNTIKTTKTKIISSAPQSGNPYAKLWSHQLIGLSTPQSAIDFVRNKHLNKEDILIIKSTRADMDWWIVLYGLYKDKQTGLESAENLPNGITNAWLRPLKNLQVNGFIEKY